MNKRKVWVEPVEPLFAEARDWHGKRRFRLRLLWRVNIEVLRIAASQNLKRLLKKRGRGRCPFPVEALCAFFLAAFDWSARLAPFSDRCLLAHLIRGTREGYLLLLMSRWRGNPNIYSNKFGQAEYLWNSWPDVFGISMNGKLVYA
jgi:hypothetical protein